MVLHAMGVPHEGAALTDPTRWLTDADLKFILKATAPHRTDHDRIRQILQDKPDLLEILLDDDRLYQQLASDDEVLLKVSPRLLFTVLLRRVRRQLRQRPFTTELGSQGNRLPVFDARDAARLIDQPQVLAYLASMLTSFVRTESRAVVVRRGATFQRRYLSDMDVDNLMTLGELAEDETQRFAIYRRVADLCLFVVGMFPEHTQPQVFRSVGPFGVQRRVRYRRREREEYESIGQESYRRAAQAAVAERYGLSEVLQTIGTHFSLASKPLNVLSLQLIPLRRSVWFEAPPA